MTIDQAVKILQHENYLDPNLETPDIIGALALGIEALKLIAQEPAEGYTCILRPLPGEDTPIDTTRSLHSIRAVLESPLGRK